MWDENEETRDSYAAARPDRPKGVGVSRWESSFTRTRERIQIRQRRNSVRRRTQISFAPVDVHVGGISIGEEVFTAERK